MSANYGGKQANQTAYIKTFIEAPPTELWNVDHIYNSDVLVPTPPYNNLYIPNNIYIGGNIIVSYQYVHSSFELTTENTLVLTLPYYEIYPLAPTADMTITLPHANQSLNGVRITFRRVGGTVSTKISSATNNIYQNNTTVASDVILPGNSYTVTICCTYLTSSTYGWFVI